VKTIRRLLVASSIVLVGTSLAWAGLSPAPPPSGSPAPTFGVLALAVLGGISYMRRRGRK
jgi:hypothetical protein